MRCNGKGTGAMGLERASSPVILANGRCDRGSAASGKEKLAP
jgi:hypothetical protein